MYLSSILYTHIELSGKKSVIETEKAIFFIKVLLRENDVFVRFGSVPWNVIKVELSLHDIEAEKPLLKTTLADKAE